MEMSSSSTEPAQDIATRIAARALADRGAAYASEVRRLLDAALVVIQSLGTNSRPRVADIVAEAGLSNDVFYRHFKSKDALVAAILEDGSERLATYVAHQMAKEATSEGKIRSWVEGVLSQADDVSASTTRAVLWNAGGSGVGAVSGPPSASGPLAALLREPLAELGSATPEFDASLATHATIGKLSDYLWQRIQPGDSDIDRITAFCLRVISPT